MTDEAPKANAAAKSEKFVCLQLKEPVIKMMRWKICKSRFCDLVDEYNQLSDHDKNRDPETDAKIRAIINHARNHCLTFEDVHSLCALITLLLPEKILRIRAEEFVADLRAAKFPAAGDMWYEMILKDWDKYTEREKRDRVVELQTRRRNLSLITRTGERLKTRLAVRSFAVMVMLSVMATIFWFFPVNRFFFSPLTPASHKVGLTAIQSPSSPKPEEAASPEQPANRQHHWMIIAALAGGLGGLISVLQRTYTAPSFDLGKTSIDEIPSTLTVMLAPFFGAVGALIIMMGLHSGLSELLPAAQREASTLTDQKIFDVNDPVYLYKLVLFSLAAGFSERAIPDTLGRLQSRFAQGKST